MEDLLIPKIGTTCPALTNENYEYHLSGDCRAFCICSLNEQPCRGRVIVDPKNKTSDFINRGQCMISQKGLKSCPVYGVSKEIFVQIIKDKMQKQMEEKLKNLNV